MDDKKIIEQLISDFRQHSSAEGQMRSSLNARVSALERELSTWDDLGFEFEKRIRTLKNIIAEYTHVLRQIAHQPSSNETHSLSRDACAKLAKDALKFGEELYEKESQT